MAKVTDRDLEPARQLAQLILGDVMVAADEGYAVTIDAKDAVLEGWTETLRKALAQVREEGYREGRLGGSIEATDGLEQLAAELRESRRQYLPKEAKDA